MSSWLFRYAVMVALCLLVLIVLGALVTSEIQPIPGSRVRLTSGAVQTAEQVHTVMAWIVGALTLGLALWLQIGEKRPWLHWLGWAILAVLVIEGWSGMESVLRSLPRAAGFLHAVLAQILFSLVVGIAGEASEGQARESPVEDSGRPSLRSLAIILLALVFLQVLLGAGYRHGIMGFLLHILNAMIVGIMVIAVLMLVNRQFPDHPSLKPRALVLATITVVQVPLGFATLIVLLISSGGTTALLRLSVAHVATGALTLAASVLFAIGIRRSVRATKSQT